MKAMEELNLLRKNIKRVGGGRRRWIEKCKEVTKILKEEKQNRWIEYVEGLDTKTNSK